MTEYNTKQIAAMIGADRVHRNVYTDPDVFDLEMARIFDRTWLFVGHESQVPNPGDFFTTEMGRQPVVMVRHTDGKVHVLYNRCGHRGAVVENLPKGNAKHFRCCYHGWVFKTNGELASVPLKNGYPEDFDLTDPQLGMVPLARVETYRGFVFASSNPKVSKLDDYLVGAKSGIDDICDRAPGGEVEIAGGVHKYVFKGNWKFQIENVVDLYHPYYSHESTLVGEGQQFKRRSGDRGGLKIEERSGQPSSQFDTTGIWAFENGHTYTGKGPTGERSGPLHEEYLRRMIKVHGKKRTQEIVDFNRHNTAVYPNLIIQSLSQHIRVIFPRSEKLTEVHVYPLRLKGAPEGMHEQVVRYLNVTHSPASFVQTDDLECFKRCQEGLQTQGSDWVVFARGLGEEHADNAPGGRGYRSLGTHEMPMRYQFRAWKKYMTESA